MFSYEHLLAFCTTFEERGYSAAARKLGKDRTTIRDQVKALEDYYAVALFVIDGKKAMPTPTAHHIYLRAEKLVRSSECLNRSLQAAFDAELFLINIYHDVSLPNKLAIKIEHELAKHFPELKINWLHRNREEAFEFIEKDNSSIALMQHRNVNATGKPINYFSLGYGELAVYAGRRSVLGHLKNITLDDLALEKQYISENDFNTLPGLYVVSPRYHLISNNDLLTEMVKHDGWAIISTALAQPFVNSGELLRLDVSEIAGHLNFGFTFYFPVGLETHPVIEAIKVVARNHFN
ncbi:LysR family transcriptional regulator [Photobacterium makurazakiensis]|uniref:LysR family transcriptional regulator n=1 Tax=Photobacterium makurazakiensis TaxID=2910234 RepID=UPI003D148AE9